jgi:hypothetical protein
MRQPHNFDDVLTPQTLYSVNLDTQRLYEASDALDACYMASWQLPFGSAHGKATTGLAPASRRQLCRAHPVSCQRADHSDEMATVASCLDAGLVLRLLIALANPGCSLSSAKRGSPVALTRYLGSRSTAILKAFKASSGVLM